jgi:hypothetical protein
MPKRCAISGTAILFLIDILFAPSFDQTSTRSPRVHDTSGSDGFPTSAAFTSGGTVTQTRTRSQHLHVQLPASNPTTFTEVSFTFDVL